MAKFDKKILGSGFSLALARRQHHALTCPFIPRGYNSLYVVTAGLMP
jgi:hypothetical protein